MCVVSAVMDQGRQMWPDLGLPGYPIGPGVPLMPVTPFWPPGRPPSDASPNIRIFPPPAPLPAPRLPTLEEIDAFLKLYEEAKRFDAATKQPDCEDPEKIKLLEQIEALKSRLEALEKRAAQQDAAEDDANIAFAASVKR